MISLSMDNLCFDDMAVGVVMVVDRKRVRWYRTCDGVVGVVLD